MNKLRLTAMILGLLVGSFFLFCFVGDTWEFRETAWPLKVKDSIILIAGPFTIFAATLLAWKRQRWPAYWLISGAVITGMIFAAQKLTLALLVLTLPMLIEGWMWLKCVHRPDNLRA